MGEGLERMAKKKKGEDIKKWGQSSLCGKILFPSESTSRNSEGLVLLAFLPPKKLLGLSEADFMELLGNHDSDWGDQEPFLWGCVQIGWHH